MKKAEQEIHFKCKKWKKKMKKIEREINFKCKEKGVEGSK